MHEFIYPVLQGYDSCVLESDLTIIGSDQLFNEMMGRFFQQRFGQQPQVIITTKITPGIDGLAKQSKSLDNYIGLGHSPRDKFGRTMRLPDSLIPVYFSVYTEVPGADLTIYVAMAQADPLEAKKRLATEIVRRYHGAEVANEERQWFDRTFSCRQIPEDAPELILDAGMMSGLEVLQRCFGDQKSNTEIRRLFRDGAVKLNGTKVSDPMADLELKDGDAIQVGKRAWFRIKLG